jgi:hypothetical protein
MRVIVADRRDVGDDIFKPPFIPEKVLEKIPRFARHNELFKLTEVHEIEEWIRNDRFRITVSLRAPWPCSLGSSAMRWGPPPSLRAARYRSASREIVDLRISRQTLR